MRYILYQTWALAMAWGMTSSKMAAKTAAMLKLYKRVSISEKKKGDCNVIPSNLTIGAF